MSDSIEILSDNMTFHGLHCFFKHLFQNLGWMILIKEEHPNEQYTIDKINTYIGSIKKLHRALKNQDRLQIRTSSEMYDIEVMTKKVEILLSHAMKDLMGQIGAGKKKKSSKKT